MSALLDLREEHHVALVVSSRSDAYGLTRARRLGIETLVLDKKIDWTKLLEVLEERGITHIFLTGFMKVITKEFLQAWKKPILNIHPSLLPNYPGLRSVERAVADGAAVGVTVHKVIADVDAGDIVLQKTVHTPTSLAVGDGSAHHNVSGPDDILFQVHVAEYDLVRRAMKVASCWT